MSEKDLSTIVKQAGWGFSGKIFSQIFQVANGILLANMLGPILLGLYQLGLRSQLFLVNFGKLGLDIGLVKYIPVSLRQDKRKAKTLLVYVLRVGFLCSIPLGILLFVFSKYIAINIFNKPDLTEVLRIFSFLLPLSTVNFLLMHANRGAKQVKYNVLLKQVLYSGVFCFILVVMYLSKWTFHTLLMSIVLLEGLMTILLFISLRRTFNFPVYLKDLIAKFDSGMGVTKKELFGFSTPLLFQGLIFYLMGTIDIFMLGYFRSVEMVGIYSVALRIALLISFVLYSFNEIFMPIISEKFIMNDFAGIKYLYQTITKWIFAFSLFLVGLIYVLQRDILLVFGEEYLPAAIPLVILCIGQLVNASVGGVGVLLETMGHQRLSLLNAVILLILNVILNYLFIERMGWDMIGAAIATSISISLVNIIRLLQLKILRDIQPYNLKYLKVIISFIPAYIVTHMLLNVVDSWFVWRILLGATVFMSTNIFIYYLIGITEEDRFILKKVGEKIYG